MHSMKWGLVPHWSKAEPPTLNTINARSENLQEGGGMWGSVKGRKRCVVVAQGYVTHILYLFPDPVSWLVNGT
jgi:putative SOS response-associated peptidase YedK